ncbi:MAG: MFS transporter [Anaerolineae bacterium]|nr:MFS transporter [Anaerolineae bacterium]
MSLFRHKLYLATILGHFTVDVFASMGAVVVTFFSVPMLMTGAQIGLAMGFFQFIGAATQPLFGWLADKIGSRWIGPGSVIWMASFMALSVLTAQLSQNFSLFLIVFSLAALGGGAFHPQGAMHASTTIAGRAATATAVFFLFGQAGLSLGPVLSGLLLDHVGAIGILALALLATPILIFITLAMRTAKPHLPITSTRSGGIQILPGEAVRWGAIGLLALVMGLRSWAFLGTVSFLPKMFQNMGWDATAYGLVTGVFWLASGIAGVIGGHLADRWGRRPVVFGTMLFGSIPLLFLPFTGSWLAFPLAILFGALGGASHSILVVIAQALLPGRKAFASGVTLGYVFGTGAFATWAIGALADGWGLSQVIQASAVVGILTALLALALPATKIVSPIEPEGIPA